MERSQCCLHTFCGGARRQGQVNFEDCGSICIVLTEKTEVPPVALLYRNVAVYIYWIESQTLLCMDNRMHDEQSMQKKLVNPFRFQIEATVPLNQGAGCRKHVVHLAAGDRCNCPFLQKGHGHCHK